MQIGAHSWKAMRPIVAGRLSSSLKTSRYFLAFRKPFLVQRISIQAYSLKLLEIAPSSQDNPILAFWIGERLNIRCTMLCHSTLDSIGSAVVVTTEV